MAPDNIVAIGFTISFPVKSGAETWIGSYSETPLSDKLAEGNKPKEPDNIEASSDKMSPKIFPVTIVENCFGALINYIASLSTYICVNSNSG